MGCPYYINTILPPPLTRHTYTPMHYLTLVINPILDDCGPFPLIAPAKRIFIHD